MKHTQGPWTVRNDGQEWAIIGAEPSWVCAFDKRNHNADANARLIAASPELLETLEDHARPLLRLAYLYAQARNDAEFCERLAAADVKIGAVLAKATGAS